MSAKTRQSLRQECGDIAELSGAAIGYISAGKRSPLQRMALKRALQLFKENRLGVVLAGSAGTELPENLQEILSLPVKTAFRAHVSDWLEEHYVQYVGELFLLPDDVWRTDKKTVRARECREMLAAWGIPPNLDLNQVRWVAPYHKDENVLAAWARRFHELNALRHFQHGPRETCAHTCGSLGEFIKENADKYWKADYRSPHGFKGMRSGLLHFGVRPVMFVPDSWVPPPHDQNACQRFGKVVWSDRLVTASVAGELDRHGYTSFEELAAAESDVSLRAKIGKLGNLQALLEEQGLQLREATSEDVLLISLTDVNKGVKNTLTQMGINTIGDIMQKSVTELLALLESDDPDLLSLYAPNARNVLWHIEKQLAGHGLKLRE